MPVNMVDWVETFFDAVGQHGPEESECMYMLRSTVDDGLKFRGRHILVYTLPEFSKFLKSDEELTDFIYVRCTQSVIVNIRGTSLTHETLVSQIMTCINDHLDGFDYDENAAIFQKEHGFVLSSVRGYGPPSIYIGEDFVFSPAEKLVFSKFNFRRV
jgi:hypothetical protein